jgi:LysR family transcriptional activator of nhaA
MESLNYNHLRYFWFVAREGSVTRAAARLHVSQPTVSAQIRDLESSLAGPLFVRAGRRLALTDLGKLVYRYASEIFALGQELLDAVRGRPSGGPVRLAVGIANVVPKLIAHRLLEPAFQPQEPVRIECYEDRPERLLADLAVHELDLALTDAPVGPGLKVRAYSHLLGESGVGIYGTQGLFDAHAGGFPRSLEGAPLLVPTPNATLRRSLDQWLETHEIRPRVVGEFEDSALVTVFGRAGAGLFAAPLAIEAELIRQFEVRRVGTLPEIRERFYAISVERRLKNPAVLAISTAARERLFG